MKHLIPALTRGLVVAFTSWRMLSLMLLFNLLFALVALLPAAQALDRMLTPMGDWQGVMARWPVDCPLLFRT